MMIGVVTMLASVALAAPSQGMPFTSAPAVDEVVVLVDGREIRALCTGGTPHVLFLHEAGGDAGAWRPVLQRLAPEISACAYDRPGTSASGEGLAPRGWYELLEEMVRIHEALGAAPGVVLVGQGAGAMYARLYAGARPEAVGGLVLIEPIHEDSPGLLQPAMPPEDWARWKAARSAVNADGIRETDLVERARRSRSPRVPVTVITATERSVPAGWDARFVDEAARQAHEALVRGRPFGRHVPARGSGPDVAGGAPAVVAEEVARVTRIVQGS